MSAATRNAPVGLAAIKKTLLSNVGSHGLGTVWADFCQLSALAIRNSVDLRDKAKREERYLQIAGGYNADEMNRFAEALAGVTNELSDELSDVLGRLFMVLELGSEGMGQFFTPYDVSVLMAQMQAPEMVELCKTQEFITVNEPTCGAGGMVIAIADALQKSGINYQKQVHVTAQDLSATAVHMTYIQLSLLGIPAVVVHGNTLTLEQMDVWYTPMHILGGWDRKLRQRSALEAVAELTRAEPPMVSAETIAPVDAWESVFAEVSA